MGQGYKVRKFNCGLLEIALPCGTLVPKSFFCSEKKNAL